MRALWSSTGRIATVTSATGWAAAGYGALTIAAAGDLHATGTTWVFGWPFLLFLLAASVLHQIAVGGYEPIGLRALIPGVVPLNDALEAQAEGRRVGIATTAVALRSATRFPVWNAAVAVGLSGVVTVGCVILERRVAATPSPNSWVIARAGLYATALYGVASLALAEIIMRPACRALRRRAAADGLDPYADASMPNSWRIVAAVVPTVVALLVALEIGAAPGGPRLASYVMLIGLSVGMALALAYLQQVNRDATVEELTVACRDLMAGIDRTLVTGSIDAGVVTAAREFNAAANWVRADRRASSDELAAQNRALREAQERLLAHDQAKTEFLGTVSHELRTPLNVFIGYTEMLLGATLSGDLSPAERSDILRRLLAGARTLSSLVEDTLSVLRLDAATVHLDGAPVSVEELFRELQDADRLLRQPGPVEERWIVDPGLPVFVSDRRKLRQVLSNLVGNARKFTDAGSIEVRATLGPAPATLRLTVTDTGSGIAAESLSAIFEAYRQAPSRRAAEGCGLGLYIVRRYVELLGGRVDCTSTLGVGTTFTVELPFDRPPEVQRDRSVAAPAGVA